MDRQYAGLSYEQAVDRYIQTVYAACLMRLSGNADVDDCVQNTFIKLFEKSPDFTDENHLTAWLLRVAINECRMSRRRALRIVPLDSVREIPLPSADDKSDLSWALLQLKPKYREALYLVYIEGMSYEKAGVIMRKTRKQVDHLVERGKKAMRPLLAEKGVSYEVD